MPIIEYERVQRANGVQSLMAIGAEDVAKPAPSTLAVIGVAAIAYWLTRSLLVGGVAAYFYAKK